jgi:DNA-binding SARP family transcriptional activator
MDREIRLYLLGPFRAERAGEPLTDFKSNKVRALLAYLAVERQQPHHRDVLAGLLWSHSSNSSALALLRDALSNLRTLLGDRTAETPYIAVVQDTLQFRLHDGGWLDVAAFTAATAPDADTSGLEHAVTLYRGDFMDGFSLSRTPEFEAWVLLQREAYRRTQQQALYRLTTHHLQAGNYLLAQATARRQLALDAYAENAHRQLLRALALDGQRNQALRHYGTYRTLLDEELGVAPDIRTTALYQRIRDHRLTASRGQRLVAVRASGDNDTDDLLFVGREAELARMEERLRQAQRGQGQVLLISGEAGSGKTLLIQAFVRRYVATAPGTVAVWGASNAQVGDGDPYLPFREMLRLLTGDFDVPTLRDSLTPALAQQLEALTPMVTAALKRFGPDLRGGLLPTDRKLTPPHEDVARMPPLPAALCDQAARVFRTLAQHCTLVLILEDLHWADRSTLNLLAYLGRRLQDSRILLIGSYRPSGASPAWIEVIQELRRRQGDITLNLDDVAGRVFVDAFLDSQPNALGPAFRKNLYRQTNGHALFTVALIQQLQAEGVLTRNAAGEWVTAEDLDWHYVPPRVEAVIATRVTQLPEDLQELLTVASVEGETFTAEVLAQALGRTTDTVQWALSGPLQTCQLINAQGLERIRDRRVARYRFRHILFQQYLYDQLDPIQRARHHEAVGLALESLYGDQPDAATRLAYHFEASGLLEKAATYLARAGAHAYHLSAPAEAIRLYRRGLALLAQLPASEARDRLELNLQMGLDMPLFADRGWGAPERAAALERAYELARRLDATQRLVLILRALADVHTAQAKHQQSLVYAQQMSALSQQIHDPTHEILSYRMQGISHLFLGHYQDAHGHFEKGIHYYTELRETLSDPADLPPIEETAFLWGWLPTILFVLGYPDQARKCSRKALDHIPDKGHVHVQAKMLTVAGLVFHATVGQPDIVLRYANELETLAVDYHLPAFKGWAVFYQGWGRFSQGQAEDGLTKMVAGWKQLRATGTEATLVQLDTLLIEAYADAGKTQRSADILRQALHLAENTNANSYLAELYRLRGRLSLQAPEEAEPWFYKAIEVAQTQAAKLWELRATIRLTQLWQTQGREAEAHARLSEIYGWFTEGFDVPDLVEARTLLANLAE